MEFLSPRVFCPRPGAPFRTVVYCVSMCPISNISFPPSQPQVAFSRSRGSGARNGRSGMEHSTLGGLVKKRIGCGMGNSTLPLSISFVLKQEFVIQLHGKIIDKLPLTGLVEIFTKEEALKVFRLMPRIVLTNVFACDLSHF